MALLSYSATVVLVGGRCCVTATVVFLPKVYQIYILLSEHLARIAMSSTSCSSLAASLRCRNFSFNLMH